MIHTGRVGILITTGAMDHELFDQLKQFRVVLRKLRGEKAIDLLWSAQLGMRLQEDNDVSMRKAPLLKLNGVKEASSITKETMCNVMNEGV